MWGIWKIGIRIIGNDYIDWIGNLAVNRSGNVIEFGKLPQWNDINDIYTQRGNGPG